MNFQCFNFQCVCLTKETYHDNLRRDNRNPALLYLDCSGEVGAKTENRNVKSISWLARGLFVLIAVASIALGVHFHSPLVAVIIGHVAAGLAAITTVELGRKFKLVQMTGFPKGWSRTHIRLFLVFVVVMGFYSLYRLCTREVVEEEAG